MKRTLYPTGDHTCMWTFPSEDGRVEIVPGTLSVRQGESPTGDVHGIELLEPGDLIPNRYSFPIVTATLASGASALLTDVEVEAFLPGRALLRAGAGVVSIAPFDAEIEPIADEIELQIEFLDALSGLMPLVPGPDSRGSWSAEQNLEAMLNWSEDGITVKLDYIVASGGMDPFSLKVDSSPRLTIQSDTPLRLTQWMDDWIKPLQEVCSLASGRSCRVTYVVLHSQVGEARRLSQLFAHGITQEPYDSDYRKFFGISTGVNLKDHNVSLLALARGWRTARDEKHPIVETYGSMLLVDEHPRSRFLLLLQSLEGAHGFQQRSSFAARLAAHNQKVTALLAKIRSCTNAKDRGTIKSALKLVHPGLEEALSQIFDSFPSEVRSHFESTSLITEVRSRTSLDAVGALRTIRNDLAHGNRGYETDDLRQVVKLLDRVVRALALQILDCPPETVRNVLGVNERTERSDEQ